MANDNPTTTPEMVERVARAILPQAWEPIATKDSVTPEGGRRLGGWMQLQDRAASIKQAKAAIAAMREPTVQHEVIAVSILPGTSSKITCRCGWQGTVETWAAHIPTKEPGAYPDPPWASVRAPEMVERVAEAAFEQFANVAKVPDNGFFLPWRNTPEGEAKANWRAIARAAIAAMREPTDQMNAAGGTAALSDGAHDCEVPMSDVWRAMCDAALMG